jgi:hypothetical protein
MKIVEIIVLIVLPLAWGLLVERVFQKWRGNPHVLRTKPTENPSDWTI